MTAPRQMIGYTVSCGDTRMLVEPLNGIRFQQGDQSILIEDARMMQLLLRALDDVKGARDFAKRSTP